MVVRHRSNGMSGVWAVPRSGARARPGGRAMMRSLPGADVPHDDRFEHARSRAGLEGDRRAFGEVVEPAIAHDAAAERIGSSVFAAHRACFLVEAASPDCSTLSLHDALPI